MKSNQGLFVITFLLLITLFVSSGSAKQADQPRQVIKFDYDWKFMLGDSADAQAVAYNDADWRDLTLPHDWSIEQPFDKNMRGGGSNAFLPGGIGWYRKHFIIPANYQGKKIFIRFDGVYHRSDVYINGRHVGYRPYGFVGFEYDLTPYLKLGGENVLAVRVNHSDAPTARWYSGSGIYRHVWLTVVNPVHVAQWGTYVTTNDITDQSATVTMTTSIKNDLANAKKIRVLSTIIDPKNREAGKISREAELPAQGVQDVAQTLAVARPMLWSLEQPLLYTLRTEVIDAQNGQVLDDYTTPFGIREIRYDVDKGFFLNGVNLKLQGVCMHQDVACLGVAVPERAWHRRLLALKELGCNAIRMSHNPPAPEMLDLCDRMGFLVIDEAFDKWKTMYYAEFFNDWWERDLNAMLQRDRNLPSIIMWSVGNEVFEQGKPDGAAILTMLRDHVHKYEPTRPVSVALYPNKAEDRGGTKNAFAPLMDIVGYNYAEQWFAADRQDYPQRIIYSAEAFPYFRGSQEVNKAYDTLNPWYAVPEHDYVIGQFIWAGFDYLGESSGWPSKGWPTCPINTCGWLKASSFFHQTVWKKQPQVYIAVLNDALDIDPGKPHWNWPKSAAHWNFSDCAGEVLRVETPTNCETVQLFLNGENLGTRRAADFPNSTIQWHVAWRPGTLTAIGRNGGVNADSCSLQTAGEPTRIVMTTDCATITADGQDIAHVELYLVDARGFLVPDADQLVTFRVEGEGSLAGVDNGDMRCNESYQNPARPTYWGRCLAIVRSTRQAGKIRVIAATADLPPSTVEIKTTLPDQ